MNLALADGDHPAGRQYDPEKYTKKRPHNIDWPGDNSIFFLKLVIISNVFASQKSAASHRLGHLGLKDKPSARNEAKADKDTK